MRDSILALTILCGAAVLLTACYSPSGGFTPASGGAMTWWSTEMQQKTITLVDVRTNEPFFTVDIPAGKQLTIDFDAGEGDDEVYTPDLMRWEIMDKGTSWGKLSSSMTVPNDACRRIEMSIRTGPQYQEASAQRSLRSDELADRPEWWTPKGGPLPEDKTVGMYDN